MKKRFLAYVIARGYRIGIMYNVDYKKWYRDPDKATQFTSVQAAQKALAQIETYQSTATINELFEEETEEEGYCLCIKRLSIEEITQKIKSETRPRQSSSTLLR